MSSNAAATDAMVSVSVDALSSIEQIVKLVPETTKVFIVIGNSPIEKLWLEEMRKLFQPLTGQLEITYSNELSLEEILKQVANLPPRTFIVYGQMLVDAAGVVHGARRQASHRPDPQSCERAYLFGTGRLLRPWDCGRSDDEHI